MMPSPSDSSRSLTSRPSTRGLTHLRLHRPWLQALLTLGLAQVLLGILVVTFSMVASSVTTTESIKRSCPSWAGFSLAFSGVVGIVSWKRPFTLVISFFSLLSVLCVMLSMAGSVLSCKNAQLARDFRHCSTVRCPSSPTMPPLLGSSQAQAMWDYPFHSHIPLSLSFFSQNLLFSVCGLTVCATIICTVSAIVCCIQIFSLDLMHTQLTPERSVSGPLGPLGCTSSPPAPLLHTMLDLEEFVPPVPPPPYYPPEYTCSSETDAQSITYNGSMDSPVPLYPTDCPPSYEAVMGLRGDSQATLFDPQLHDGSCICERVASIVDGEQKAGRMDQGRRPGRAEPRGSQTGGDKAEVVVCGQARAGAFWILAPVGRDDAPWLGMGWGAVKAPLGLHLTGGWWAGQVCPLSKALSGSPSTADFRDLYTKVFEEEAASVSSADTGLCSEACLFHLARCPSPKLLRAHSAGKQRPVPTYQKVPLPSGPTPAHSLGDLKGSWPGRALVTRFLQMSRKTPDPGGNGAHGHKQVPRGRWGRPGRESLHLRSCGDLSSGSSLRRLLSGRRLERGTRPHSLSLNGGTRETGL
ncbi:PREDICTED: protein FAM189B [Myotis davidii]|uniref:protein FAM189B n=1 Tax=Myotis davidii TaxID=225400 RepID=UPI000766EC62|nr:PREDICTED: protein FAM189B [Myotis davidii]